jgi:hypothetical protein
LSNPVRLEKMAVDPTLVPLYVQAGMSTVQTGMTVFQRRENRRATDVFSTMLENTEMTADTLLEVMEQEDLFSEIFERATRAGAATSFASKRRLLGRVVIAAIGGSGLATPDRYLLLVRSIDAIEPAHVDLLAILATPRPTEGTYAGSASEGWFSLADVQARWPELADMAHPVLATLIREGLIEEMGTFGGNRAFTPSKHGRLLLAHLVAEELDGKNLEVAAPVVRIEESPRFSIVVRNIGPGISTDVSISVPPQEGEEIITTEGSEMMGFDLDVFEETSIPIRTPTLKVKPPYSVRVRWSDVRGPQVHVFDLDRQRD